MTTDVDGSLATARDKVVTLAAAIDACVSTT